MRYIIALVILLACSISYADVSIYNSDGTITTIHDNGDGSGAIYGNGEVTNFQY